MKTLSYVQEYFLCATNSKGNMPAFDTAFPVCLVAGGIMALLSHGYIAYTEKTKVIAGKAWDDDLPYLKPLYETIVNAKKPKDAHGIVEEYVTLSQKPFNALSSAVGLSLVESGCADKVTHQGLLKEKTRYVPKAEAVTRAIEKIRSAFLADGIITNETFCLAALLDKSDIIRHYFSKVEKEAMKKRIMEVRQSEAYAFINGILAYIEAYILTVLMIPAD